MKQATSYCILLFLLLTSGVSAAPKPEYSDIEYARVGDRKLRLDLYHPAVQQDKCPLIIWIHGGAWRAGSKDDVPIHGMLRHGFAIASIEYRLSTEAQFPAQMHDIKSAIRFLRTHAEEYQVDPDHFILAGSSAGGHLAALAGVTSGVESLEGKVGRHDDSSSAVQAIVSFYGAANLTNILGQSTPHGVSVREPALKLLLGGLPEEEPDLAVLASPVKHVDLKDPPLWLIHGNADPQMPIEQSLELRDCYQDANLPVAFWEIDGAMHGGPEFYSDSRLSTLAAQLKQETPKREPVRLLFAGSSSTYWNDLPGEVAKVVSGKVTNRLNDPATAEIVGRSGSDIRVYQNDNFRAYQYGVKPGQTFLEKVRDESFDFVSLMVVCRFITGDGDPEQKGKAHADAISHYCQKIREAGSEPLFYEMGWGKSEREAEGRRRILELARENEIDYFAPCSTAWAIVYNERPELALQHPNDSSHPGDLGHFLNLACFYTTLTRQSPVGELPRTFHVWPHLTKEEKITKQTELDNAFSKFSPDSYQERLPDWMQRNSGAGYVANVSESEARYLENVAWRAWKQVESQLRKEQMNPSR